MRKIYTNLYKRPDIFSCPHSAHHKFGGVVTPYHVLAEKKCYPDGCMVFVWKCRLLDKGHACPKKFKHVGRECFSCRQFFEEKYHQKPRLRVSENEFDKFGSGLEDLEFWLDRVVGRELEVEATIRTVKPNFRSVGGPKRDRYLFTNWLAVLDSAHIGYDLFDDVCFARLSDRTEARFRLCEGDHFVCRATPVFDRGRLIFTRLHDFEVTDGGSEPDWDRATAEVAAATAVRLRIQAERCLGCRYGCLIDRMYRDKRNGSRELLCLAGQKLPEECVYPLTKFLRSSRS
jgi:hypothetical protein